jgi:hypothetical protein
VKTRFQAFAFKFNSCRYSEAAAAAVVADERAAHNLPPPPTGIPATPEPGAFSSQPPRSPPKVTYVDLADELEGHGERCADPMPGANVDHIPRLEFAATGIGLGPSGRELDADFDDDDAATEVGL